MISLRNLLRSLPTTAMFFLVLLLMFSQNLVAQTTIADMERPKTAPKKEVLLYKLVDMTHAHMYFEVDPSKRYITGNVRLNVKAKEENQKQLSLDLSSSLKVNEVWWNGEVVEKSKYDHSKNLLTVSFDAPMSKTTPDSARIYYEGNPPRNGFEGFSQSKHSSGSIVWTLSEPYSAKDWWPAQHTLLDKVDSMDIIIRSPKGNLAASNGLLVSEIDIDNYHLDHWRHKHPIATYLVAFAVTNYERYNDYVTMGDKKIEVQNYVYPQALEYSKRNTKNIVDIMQLFNRLFTPYPFADEKYGHAQFSWGGGMEHQTMSFMGSFSFGLQAHELAHQWFGNYITCGSWKEIWLNEGFATYLEGLCYENGLGGRSFEKWLSGQINSVTSRVGGSLYVDDTTSVYRVFSSRLSYDKGSMVLHMLRKQIGDEAFFNGVKAYLNDEELQHSFATTSKIMRHFEEASGEDLHNYFQDWIFFEGYPTFELRWAQDKDKKLLLNLVQASSTGNDNLFELKVPITLVSKDSSKKIWLNQTQHVQNFTEEIDIEVEDVLLNADYDIITRRPSVIRDQKLLLEDASFSKALKVTPNPAKDSIEVFWKEDVVPSTIVLINSSGKQVRTEKVKDQTLSVTLSISDLPAGVYVVKAMGADKTFETKFIKQ